jgi:proteic killer suppression protein
MRYAKRNTVIKTFRDKATAAIFVDRLPRGMSAELARAARRKLVMLDRATDVNDLRSPPGNRLEALGGERAGQFSIRINQQWRICFIWCDSDAFEVEIIDYH